MTFEVLDLIVEHFYMFVEFLTVKSTCSAKLTFFTPFCYNINSFR